MVCSSSCLLQKSILTLTETKGNDLLSLQWPSPPRNILLVKKDNTPQTTEAVIEFAKYTLQRLLHEILHSLTARNRHVHSKYPSTSFLTSSPSASEIHKSLPFPIYGSPTSAAPSTSIPSSPHSATTNSTLAEKTDLVATFGGDGTILRASSLFATSPSVPPILSFSMGTLGFLNEWNFGEFKRAFRELYMSGAPSSRHDVMQSQDAKMSELPVSQNAVHTIGQGGAGGWSANLGTSLGPTRTARVLLRNRLRVAISNANGETLTPPHLHALNEIILHRGASPHLTHLTISISGRILTEAVADGLIISTPTGSTAYSLSAGGSIVHPLVKGIVLTPICARSLSFRPLVLPGEASVEVKVSGDNRGDAGVEVSIDGVRTEGVGIGMGVKVWGEAVGRRRDLGLAGHGDEWVGGVPCVMRGQGREGASGDEGWVGGLNGLLKFNYPFGEEN